MKDHNTNDSNKSGIINFLIIAQVLSVVAIVMLAIRSSDSKATATELATELKKIEEEMMQIRQGDFEKLTASDIQITDEQGRVRLVIHANNIDAGLTVKDVSGQDRFVLSSKEETTFIKFNNYAGVKAVLLDEFMGANGLNVFYDDLKKAAEIGTYTPYESAVQTGAIMSLSSRESKCRSYTKVNDDSVVYQLTKSGDTEKVIHMQLSKDESPFLSLLRADYYTCLSPPRESYSFATGYDGVNRAFIGATERGTFINLLDQSGTVRLSASEDSGKSAFATYSESGDISGRMLQKDSNTSLEIYEDKNLLIKVPNK